MKISFNWLKEFINLNEHSPYEIAELLTMKTCEVEKVHLFLENLKDVYVAKVDKVEKHPNADRLKICRLHFKRRPVTIVTGANNIESGSKYPMVLDGAVLPNGVKVKKSKLRGVESEGMLCSQEEIGMQEFILEYQKPSHDLLTLPDTYMEGESLKKIFPFSDLILNIDNKSLTHRPDLWGHLGFARELSVILKRPLLKDIPSRKNFNGSIRECKDSMKINIQGGAALAYSGVIFEDIQTRSSPLKMQARLISVGMKPHNNLIDISNYVMLEIGQPNHAFDKSLLSNKIMISFSREGEQIKTLDNENRKLPSGIVLIRDEERPVAVGGIIGGANSEIKPDSKTIFLESASFHRKYIRKAVSALGLRTQASQRFEKGLDPALTESAIYRYAELLKESCPDLSMGSVHTIQTEPILENEIKTTIEYIRERLGNIEIGRDDIIQTLKSLNMRCKKNGEYLLVNVPSYRSYFDIQVEEDLVEEIGRICGYDQIKAEAIHQPCKVPAHPNKKRELEHQLREIFSNTFQFTEVYNYSFHTSDEIHLDQRYSDLAIPLKNPPHQELKYLRVSPLPGILSSIRKNQKRNEDIKLYEIERIFLPKKNTLPLEAPFIAGAIYSQEDAGSILEFLNSILGDSLSRLGLPHERIRFTFIDDPVFHPGRTGAIQTIGSKKILYKWGELHPWLLKEAEIYSRIFYFEAFLDILSAATKNQPCYSFVPKYPSSSFELTILTENKTTFEEIKQILDQKSSKKNTSKTSIEKIECLGHYKGGSIADDKKAVSLRLVWRNPDRTIEHDELKNLQDSLVATLNKAGYPLR